MFKYAYCIACNAGSEAALARDLMRQLPEARVIYPLMDRQEKREGKWVTRSLPLIPGYLFVYSGDEIPARHFFRAERVNRVLGYMEKAGRAEIGEVYEKNYSLAGGDLAFARWVYENGGHIKVSQAALKGGRVEIMSGPLKYYEGCIKKLDKHVRKALVTVSVGDAQKDIWLSFEWLKVDGTTVIEP